MKKILAKKIKILVFLCDRANYGRLKPVIQELYLRKNVNVEIACCGSMLLEKYGFSYKVIQNEGFKINYKFFSEVDGANHTSMTKSIALTINDFSNVLNSSKPDKVVIIGDRYEALGAAIASSFQNITIAHIQGGEKSGSIDESIRHAITKFSHIHFPATKEAKENIIQMGENKKYIFNYGCPSADYLLKLENLSMQPTLNYGVGAKISFDKKYLIVIYHPDTKNNNEIKPIVERLLEALSSLKIQTIWLWPNIDAGSDLISKKLRVFRERHKPQWLHLVKNLDPSLFSIILKNATCAIGNSSSFVRDTTFHGTPVVLLGSRQNGRQVGKNVTFYNNPNFSLANKIKKQINHGRYESQYIYGKQGASKKIVDKIISCNPPSSKEFFSYSHEFSNS